MTLKFRLATKEQARLRLGIYGPSGAGKTLTALRLATGMECGSIALIDTEHGSASMYADRYEFDVLELPNSGIETYLEAISLAAKAEYPILIVDSLTHAWQDLLDQVDKIARARYSGNRWSAWSDATPLHRRLVTALLSYPGHLIGTMRTKTEWAVEKTDEGKVRPVRMGLAPEQGKGIEYEFDLLMEINADHFVTVIKDRTGRFQDRHIEKPGEDFGAELMHWLREGEPPVAAEPGKESAPKAEQPNGNAGWIYVDQKRKAFWAKARKRGLSHEDVHSLLGLNSMKEYTGSETQVWKDLDAAIVKAAAEEAKQQRLV